MQETPCKPTPGTRMEWPGGIAPAASSSAEVMAGPPLRIARTLPASSDSGPTLMRRLDESPRAASGNRTTNAPARAADKSLESESSAQVNAAHKAETAQ